MNNTVKIFQPSGRLNAITGNKLRREIKELIWSEKNIIVLIDLQNVNFIDSSGLGILISAMQMIKSSNSQFFICSVNQQVKMLFELTKMDQIFKIFSNKDEFERQILTIQLSNSGM
ncbi:STAS domain-containing protein [Aetokthonos hydrillicola Thurmond2011]|jgi:anti-anti-sigma factor|uniref:Anti-sigma factor antagonist n=1 Tax=Aetokthonos hydrillicola Thurmond2011 TaxID=2712845 RepID=A0AAP5M5B7_9CYAN|nr:STAS domain-containing protein [Aetokthonos hydrillicola]MBO3461798.1 STAS domain-containing protein [Aetokthonos hydrillicola CCALA 1050]MBW4589942.1 STAS domain-containing protein [Aetokthonos hydrillicola CCALA 1050]MDR9895731.1 STAS domain-containing protein [Aetokthonos hydrillicola Thurmond2011]